MAWYTGKIYRGVDYHGSWPGWNSVPGTQTEDSDFANDAFASLWGKGYQAAPPGDPSQPFNNGSNYRDDLGTIAKDGFNLIRLYDWNMARGTTATSDTGLDHINFLNYAQSLGIKVVVPVSNYFLSNNQFAWNNAIPDSNYSFDHAPDAIKKDFKQFISSITDPTTGKIHEAVMISVSNEPDYLAGPIAEPPVTTASQALARINWWIYNLHQQINGTSATGPDGLPVVNGANGAIVPIGATFGNGDQTGQNGSWFKALLSGAQAGQGLPSVWAGATTFTESVTGLAQVDPNFASYYFNSFNIGQSSSTPPYNNSIAQTLALLDSGASPWPGATFNVPMMLMEVFTPNRTEFSSPAEMAKAAVKEAKDIEAYLALHKAGTPSSTTNIMGYNYFEFNDEPGARNKTTGLYQFGDTSQIAHTGTTALFHGGFGDITFPVYTLKASVGPDGTGTLAGAWTAQFPQFLNSHNDAFVVLQGNSLGDAAPSNALMAATVPFGVMTNDISEEAASVALRTLASHGDLQLGADGAVAYTAHSGFSGIDYFSYFAFGEYGTSDNSGVAIHVVPVSVGAATTTLSLLAVTPAELVAATYAAYLGRAADAAGYEFWLGHFNKLLPTQGVAGALANVAHSFGTSAEAKALYPFLANPGGASDAQIAAFVDGVYESLFDRAPDAPGSAYWVGHTKQALQAGRPADLVVVDIMSGAQETAATQDITTLMSRVALSMEYVRQQELHGTVWAGASDVAAATTLLHGVTADPESLLIGIKNAEQQIANHP